MPGVAGGTGERLPRVSLPRGHLHAGGGAYRTYRVGSFDIDSRAILQYRWWLAVKDGAPGALGEEHSACPRFDLAAGRGAEQATPAGPAHRREHVDQRDGDRRIVVVRVGGHGDRVVAFEQAEPVH